MPRGNYKCEIKIVYVVNLRYTFLYFQFIEFAADPEYLFSPLDGAAKHERAILESYFPTDYSAFEPGRVSRHGKFGRLLIGAKDGGSLLREGPLNEALGLHGLVVNITVEDEDEAGVFHFGYEDICATWEGREIIDLASVAQYLRKYCTTYCGMMNPVFSKPFF